MKIDLNNADSIDVVYEILVKKYPGARKKGNNIFLEYEGAKLAVFHNKGHIFTIARDVSLIKSFLLLVAVTIVVTGLTVLIAPKGIGSATMILVGALIYLSIQEAINKKSQPAMDKLGAELKEMCGE